ncbi:MAG TPA: sigma-70 family RNA polymerase sigma factor [Acidimicrobiales bacterium]
MTAQAPDQGAARPTAVGERIADALCAACHPRAALGPPVGVVSSGALALMSGAVRSPSEPAVGDAPVAVIDVDRLVVELFEREGRSLVRMARLFVDDRNAAEDLVQEAFIRLARSAGKIKDESKATAYLRSIVLNLARDENRRGLVSLRHHLPFDPVSASFEDELLLRDDQRVVIEALRDLPHRQRDCLVLRYYQELGIDDIAETLGISRNSVKTHLKRGLVAMEERVT